MRTESAQRGETGARRKTREETGELKTIGIFENELTVVVSTAGKLVTIMLTKKLVVC